MDIDAKGITVLYTKRKNRKEIRTCALDTTDFKIIPGKVTVIMGRSGSGKTTLLSVLAGLLRPSAGTVFYNGADIYNEKDEDFSLFRNKNIGFIPQGQSLIDNLTVRENILLPKMIYGEKTDISACRISANELIDQLGLSGRADYYPGELSGGEVRRCAIARAVINEPAVIFADEPTGDLDDENTEIVFELLKLKAREGAAVVIVTHEQSAVQHADIVYRMDGGKLKTVA